MEFAVLFDLDGVLVDSKLIHYEALNKALAEVDEKFCITKLEQAEFYEGLTTKNKLEILHKIKGLPRDVFDDVWKSKQLHTAELFKDIRPDIKLVKILKEIKDAGWSIGVVSNSIRETLDVCLHKLGIHKYVDASVSNEDVVSPKPSPEGYKIAMRLLGVEPYNTIIFEDSVIGMLAAIESGGFLVPIDSRKDLEIEKVRESMSRVRIVTNFNILIPMAGAGSRFVEGGYTVPKPLVEVKGATLIKHAVDSLEINNGKHIYLARAEHIADYALDDTLREITEAPNSVVIIPVEALTEGAAATTLLAKDLIDNESPVIICNSDQIAEFDTIKFLQHIGKKNLDGCIAVFESTDPKWSYVSLDEDGHVDRVAEKEVISNTATVGIYYWKHGSDYVKYAEQMIAKDIRTNGEFYVAPVYNEAIADNKVIGTYAVDKMISLGTPEDVEAYAAS